MMIKSSLQLNFFLCIQIYISVEWVREKEKFGSVFDYFTVILDLWNIESFQQLNPAFCLGGWVGGGGVGC